MKNLTEFLNESSVFDQPRQYWFQLVLAAGYFKYTKARGGDDKTYLVTPENIIGDNGIFDEQIFDINQAKLNKIIKDMEADGIYPRFKNNKDGEKTAKENGWIILK